MSFREFVKVCLIQKYATMSGRESYVEYRWLQLFLFLAIILIICISLLICKDAGDVEFVIYFILLILILDFCVFVRRLHDCGHSGAIFWWPFLISIWDVWWIGNIITICSQVKKRKALLIPIIRCR